MTSSAEGDPFPSVSVDPDVAFTKDPPERRIYIPRLAPVQFTGRVLDVDDSAVPGATVRFLSIGVFDGSPSGLEGSFSASVVTDVYGIFAVELLPGAYSISVTPPEDVENTWGVLTLDALAGEGLTEAEPWVLPSQISLRGQVETFQDELASGVTVLARARLGEDLGIVHRSQEVVSNEMGDYELGVDTGLYDMHLKMSSETGFAWLIEPELVMSPALGDLERDYRLVPPIPVRGVIRAGDGAAVPNASIRAYVFANVEGGASRPIQVAETVSDEDGNYRLLLTPRLGDE